MLGRKVICVRCINCPYNNIAKGIRLYDKIAIFVYSGKKSFVSVLPGDFIFLLHVCLCHGDLNGEQPFMGSYVSCPIF